MVIEVNAMLIIIQAIGPNPEYILPFLKHLPFFDQCWSQDDMTHF